MITLRSLLGVSGLATVVALTAPGCATKKFVRQSIAPVEQRIGEVEKKSNEVAANLAEKTEKDISRVEERAIGADGKARDAARAAQQADWKALQANQSAQSAQQLAQQNQSKLSEMERMLENIDKYKLVGTEEVYFGFNQSVLTQEAKSKLEQIAQQAAGMNNQAVFEIEGYTDQTGPREYNLVLSRRRADTVARYLVNHNIPLRRIQMLGLGSEQPVGEGDRKSRREMRRVVIRVYAPEAGLAAQQARATTLQQP